MAAAADIDAYLAEVPEPKRSTLQAVRASIRRIVPDADECISYNMPAFRLDGKVVAGFAAFKHHLAYLPHSGGVFHWRPLAWKSGRLSASAGPMSCRSRSV